MIYGCQKEKSAGQELIFMHKYVSQKRLDLPLKGSTIARSPQEDSCQ